MPTYLIMFLVAAFIWRLTTVAISARHEKSLKARGGREFGHGVSLLLAASHVVFYFSTVVEAIMNRAIEVTPSYLGIAIFLCSAVALISVMRSLGSLWTIKLIIAPGHQAIKSGLFSFVRHPNYFVSIIPELIGLGLAMNAYWTLCVGLPLYALPLYLRIRQEENVMKELVPGY